MRIKQGMIGWMALLAMVGLLTACGSKEDKPAAQAATSSNGLSHIASDEFVTLSVGAMKQFIELVKAGQDDKAIEVANKAYDYFPNPNDRSAADYRANAAKSTIKMLRDHYDMATFEVMDKGMKDHFGAARIYYKAKKKVGGQDDNDYFSWKPNSQGQPYMVLI